MNPPESWADRHVVVTGAADRAETRIGSGTHYAEFGLSCVAKRRAIETIADGKPTNCSLRLGDTVRMGFRTRHGAPAFGGIERKVVQA